MQGRPGSNDAPPRRTIAFILAGLMTGLILGFLDVTIVATAGPTIISDLGGLSLYAWVFSSFVIVQTVVIPIFGKMSDLYGRKRFFLIGLVVFMVGSVFSGASQNIYELILFRALQGIGFGTFVPSTIAIAGDLFPPEKRARVQGLLFSVNGIAFAIAPAAGSYIVDALSWRWIFYVNLPVGIVSFFIILFALKEQRMKGAPSFSDWGGAATLGLSLALFMSALSLGGSTFAWYSSQEFLVFLGSFVSLVTFITVERKANEPVLPLRLFRRGAIPAVAAVNILRAVILFGIIAYLPLFAQAVLQGSVGDVRNVVYAFTLPVTLGTLLSGSAVSRVGTRNTILVGAGVLFAGLAWLQTINQSSSLLQLMEVSLPLGFGSGFMIAPAIAGFQNSVERKEIGVASALSTFTLNLGGAIGVAVLGAIQTNVLSVQLSGLLSGVQPSEGATLGDPNVVGQILTSPQALARAVAANPGFAQVVPPLRLAFSNSIVSLFSVLLGVSVVLIFAGLLIKAVGARPVQPMVRRQEAPEPVRLPPNIETTRPRSSGGS